MNQEDYDAFAKAMQTLALRKAKVINQTLIDAYFKTLRKFDKNIVFLVFEEWPLDKKNKFFPQECEILDILKSKSAKRLNYNPNEPELRKNLKELKEKMHALNMKILSKGIGLQVLKAFPNWDKKLGLKGALIERLTADYSHYSCPETLDELYVLEKELQRQILYTEFLIKNPNGGNLKWQY